MTVNTDSKTAQNTTTKILALHFVLDHDYTVPSETTIHAHTRNGLIILQYIYTVINFDLVFTQSARLKKESSDT